MNCSTIFIVVANRICKISYTSMRTNFTNICDITHLCTCGKLNFFCLILTFCGDFLFGFSTGCTSKDNYGTITTLFCVLQHAIIPSMGSLIGNLGVVTTRCTVPVITIIAAPNIRIGMFMLFKICRKYVFKITNRQRDKHNRKQTQKATQHF